MFHVIHCPTVKCRQIRKAVSVSSIYTILKFLTNKSCYLLCFINAFLLCCSHLIRKGHKNFSNWKQARVGWNPHKPAKLDENDTTLLSQHHFHSENFCGDFFLFSFVFRDGKREERWEGRVRGRCTVCKVELCRSQIFIINSNPFQVEL